MTRYSNRRNKFSEVEDEYSFDRSYADEIRQHRREKRMKNALKSRKIDELMDYDEDEY